MLCTTWSAPARAGADKRPFLSPMPDPLPELSGAALETLLAALDPCLDGFGAGESCLDDAEAYLVRLGVTEAPLLEWIERWRAVGGDRQSLRLLVSSLIHWQGGAQSEGLHPTGADASQGP